MGREPWPRTAAIRHSEKLKKKVGTSEVDVLVSQ